MGYTWIPHVFDTLPFFQMDAESRQTFLEEAFGIRDGVCSDRGFDLPGVKGPERHLPILHIKCRHI